MTEIVITGEFHSLVEKSFKDKKGVNVKYFQLSFLTDDPYRPLLQVAVTESVARESDLLDEEVAQDTKGSKITATGHIKNQGRQVGEQWITVPKITIDSKIDWE